MYSSALITHTCAFRFGSRDCLRISFSDIFFRYIMAPPIPLLAGAVIHFAVNTVKALFKFILEEVFTRLYISTTIVM